MFDRDPGLEEEQVSFITKTKKGSKVKRPVKLRYRHGRIELVNLPFALKDEIKACLSQPRWDNENRYWSVADDIRSRFQIMSLTGGNPYANWDKPLIQHEYSRPLMSHQREMTDHALTYHFKILAAEVGVGKSLSLIETMERSGKTDWWYISSKSGCAAVDLEFDKWGLAFTPELMTYEGLLKRAKAWNPGDPVPQGIIFDEYSRCTNAHAQRAQAGQLFADALRAQWGWDAYLIGASGSCSPKSPVGWWKLCEIIMPGFLRENNAKSFEWRLGIFQEKNVAGQKFPVRVAWRDDERRCDICGEFEEVPELDENDEIIGHKLTHVDCYGLPSKDHAHTPSKNEVALLHERMQGLTTTWFMKDCWELPELTFQQEILEPTPTVKRAARALAGAARSTIQALTWLRSLSDGFQYELKETETLVACSVCHGSGVYKEWEAEEDEEEVDAWSDYQKKEGPCEYCEGTGEVPKFIREAKYFKGPKQEALERLLDKCEEHGRVIVSAGFTASIDRCVQICHNKKWDVVRIDGRGWKIMKHNGERASRGVKPLKYWATCPDKVAIVMHPESGGTGLTLVEAYMTICYSNDFKPENRIQLIGRTNRPGQTRGAVVVDLIHLGTDRKVLDTLNANHRLEKLSLGELREALND